MRRARHDRTHIPEILGRYGLPFESCVYMCSSQQCEIERHLRYGTHSFPQTRGGDACDRYVQRAFASPCAAVSTNQRLLPTGYPLSCVSNTYNEERILVDRARIFERRRTKKPRCHTFDPAYVPRPHHDRRKDRRLTPVFCFYIEHPENNKKKKGDHR